MGSCNFEKFFNDNMSSREALHVYVTLLKRVEISQRDALGKAYDAAYGRIIRRECEECKRYGMMY